MKRLVLVAGILALAACTAKKDDATMADTSVPAMAPAPATMDPGMMMRDSIVRDSLMKDSVAKAKR